MRPILRVFLLLLIPLAASSQLTTDNLQKLELGITMGVNQGMIQPEFAAEEFISSEIQDITKEQNPGIEMGIMAGYRLNDHFKFQGTVAFTFYDTRLKYLIQQPNQSPYTHAEYVSVLNLEVPFHVMATPFSIDHRPSLVTGPRYGYTLGKNSDELKLNYARHQLAWDVGVAASFPTRYFTVSPHLIYTAGITELASLGRGTIGSSVESIQRNTIRLSVYLH